ncbi:glycosyl transferases group 1 family protein [Candidatus Endolissoclinum faulkneri L2]|uniref:Glycosyl transferases group 1 family protein n=1 Tax=Candidatus Endolissoclinum faulkneri L2 TaxID=1193729 RepID=K7YIF7_9PROT|nr:glycosyltransferase family 4 protein [Candidatus Endolissoclinum faulkneri]AFX99395.1 glycosyl transferases group 1 family protein [Candidatus Endolissoclinum faulkneri L2]
MMNSPTILQLLPSLVSGGIERGSLDLAKAIIQANWRSIIVSRGGPLVSEVEQIGATHIKLPIHSKNPLCWRATFNSLVNLIYSENIDLIHARSRIPAWLGLNATKRSRLPFVTTFHQHPHTSTFIKRGYNSVMARGDRVIAVSHYIANRLLVEYKIDKDRLRIIPRGVDLELFAPNKVPTERIIRVINKWQIPKSIPILLMPGRLSAWKGHRLVIDVLAHHLKRGSLYCLMVGDYTAKPKIKKVLESYARACGVDKFVQIVGCTDDMPAVYKLSDVVVSASLIPEPFGRVMIEAQAMGRPIVAFNHGGARETVLMGETGWLVKPGDSKALANGILTALSLNKSERASLATKAVANVREHFSCTKMCNSTLKVYKELLNTRGYSHL